MRGVGLARGKNTASTPPPVLVRSLLKKPISAQHKEHARGFLDTNPRKHAHIFLRVRY